MNKAYEVIDNGVIVYNEYKEKSTRKLTNNIEEILITENNIEKINEFIFNELYLYNSNGPKLAITLFLGIGIVNFTIGALKLFNGEDSQEFNFLISFIFGLISYPLGIRPFIKEKKKLKLKRNLLYNTLNLEKNKLNELNINKSDNSILKKGLININFDKNKISDLKDKLNGINFYIHNKNKLIKLYKKNVLNDEFFKEDINKNTINFIMELIKNDVYKNDTKIYKMKNI